MQIARNILAFTVRLLCLASWPRAIVTVLIVFCAFTSLQVKAGEKAVASRAHPHYRLGKAPRGEFKAGHKTYKIDPEAASTKHVRALSSEQFDPTTRRQRVEEFYRTTLKDHFEESRRSPPANCGPFRGEFITWTGYWPAALRARWAWHHRVYIEDTLWTRWMADTAFAAEIDTLQHQNVAAVVGYLPSEYAATSPVFVYNEEYLNAAYNPMPLLAVLTLKNLKPDEKSDWIGTAAAESLVSKLSGVPGLFVAERQQVTDVLRDQHLQEPDVAEPESATKVGKALDVEQMVVGSYVVDGEKVLFNLQIVEVQTGRVQNGISKTVAREHLLDEMPDLASSLADNLGYQSQDQSLATTPPDPAKFVEVCKTCTPQQVNAMTNGGADLKAADNDGMTPLMLAAAYNANPDVILALLKAGADVSAKDKIGRTPLQCAARYNVNPDVITALLKGGADVNAKNEIRCTPLMSAARYNSNSHVIAALLNAGADVNAKDKDGLTALMFATWNNSNSDAIAALLKAHPDINAKNTYGRTALDVARANNNQAAVAALLKAGAQGK